MSPDITRQDGTDYNPMHYIPPLAQRLTRRAYYASLCAVDSNMGKVMAALEAPVDGLGLLSGPM